MKLVRCIAILAALPALAGFGTPSSALTVQDSASDLYLDVSSGLQYFDNYESLSEFLERTRGLAGPPRMEESPLPRKRRLDD